MKLDDYSEDVENSEKYLTLQKIVYLYGITRQVVYKLELKNPDFPKCLRVKVRRGYGRPTVKCFITDEIVGWFDRNNIKRKR